MTDTYKQIDADSHIQEIPDTWENYLDEKFHHRIPKVIDNPYVSFRPERNKTWFIDGDLIPKCQGHGGVPMSIPAITDFAKSKGIPPEVQGCSDPLRRVEFMRECNLDKTVVYSTLFLQTVSDDLEYEAALARSWSTWMSENAKATEHFIEFAAPIPLRDTHIAITELKKAKELGAATAMVLPMAGQKMLHDASLDPFWATAQEMDMPIAVHIGWPNPVRRNECGEPMTIFLGDFDLSLWWGYASFLCGGILERFPKLRVAFIEGDARVFETFMIRAMHWYPTSAAKPWPQKMSPEACLKDREIYFSFEGDYNYMPYFLNMVGEDRVMGALDFPHTHYGVGANLSVALDLIRNHKELTESQKKKVLLDNSVAFYGFKDI